MVSAWVSIADRIEEVVRHGEDEGSGGPRVIMETEGSWSKWRI